MIEFRRMWVNQPSKSDRLHRLHGKRIYATQESSYKCARIYFLEGPVVSQQAPWSALSEGWVSLVIDSDIPEKRLYDDPLKTNPQLRTKD